MAELLKDNLIGCLMAGNGRNGFCDFPAVLIFQRGSCAKSSTLQDFARCYRWHSCAAWTWIRPQPVLPSTIQILLVPQTWSECKWPKVFFWCPLTALAAVNTHNFTHGIPFHQAKFAGYWKSEEVDRFQCCVTQYVVTRCLFPEVCLYHPFCCCLSRISCDPTIGLWPQFWVVVASRPRILN